MGMDGGAEGTAEGASNGHDGALAMAASALPVTACRLRKWSRSRSASGFGRNDGLSGLRTRERKRQRVSRGLALWRGGLGAAEVTNLRNTLTPAAIGRAEVRIGSATLDASTCNGEVEAGGHALRWRLSFGRGAAAEEIVPRWLRPVARLRGSGYVLPHPAMRVTGAMEVDGRILELSDAPGMQGHLWGRSRWPAWAWARSAL